LGVPQTGSVAGREEDGDVEVLELDEVVEPEAYFEPSERLITQEARNVLAGS
jgi:hypothetical protein